MFDDAFAKVPYGCEPYTEPMLITDKYVVKVDDKKYKKYPAGLRTMGYPAVVTLLPLAKFSEDRTSLVPIYEDKYKYQCLIEFSNPLPFDNA